MVLGFWVLRVLRFCGFSRVVYGVGVLGFEGFEG